MAEGPLGACRVRDQRAEKVVLMVMIACLLWIPPESAALVVQCVAALGLGGGGCGRSRE